MGTKKEKQFRLFTSLPPMLSSEKQKALPYGRASDCNCICNCRYDSLVSAGSLESFGPNSPFGSFSAAASCDETSAALASSAGASATGTGSVSSVAGVAAASAASVTGVTSATVAGFFLGSVYVISSERINSTKVIVAASPGRLPILTIRVYPPLTDPYRPDACSKTLWTTCFSRTIDMAFRRACRSPRFAKVTI